MSLCSLFGDDKRPESRGPWEFEFHPKNKGKKCGVWDCFYCGLRDGKVEAGGIWYCPNGHCPGPGGAWFRAKLKSYRDDGSGHTVDGDEWKAAWDLYVAHAKYEASYGKPMLQTQGIDTGSPAR